MQDLLFRGARKKKSIPYHTEFVKFFFVVFLKEALIFRGSRI